ncbi:MFS transporter [Gordonia sp. zg691]|uniref:MFS transporter n=1 Tax=Gordonia jinghuaiqii TaxID=2758710 RepID=A0A7D7QG04_9ACTN|nr:MFS transporter [Gordonia jinghuaiqii]MBD0859670.1 MFS transporter [Gordonia jinghuaiqii]MCR5976894.1 MFS transporter [Gordonia jinghuaiqii]QMT00482.1 MFS transporter [Gordonia jinghuaiqii]
MSNTRWRMFALLLLLVTVNYVDRGSLSVALPLIKEEFHISAEVTGLLLSAFFWAYAAMQIPAGWLIDKFGPRKLITGACVGWGGATALSGLAPNIGTMAVARGLIGVTEAPIMPAGGKLNAAFLTEKERGRGATILDAGAPLGSAVGGIAIAGLIAFTGSWRWAFIVAGAVTMLLGFWAWRAIRDTPAEHPTMDKAELDYLTTAHAEEAAHHRSTGRRAGLLHYVKYRSFWAMCLGWLGFNGVFYGLLTWGPLFLSESKGFNLNEIGWSTFMIFGSGFVGEIIGGQLADRLKERGHNTNLVMRSLLGFAGVCVVLGLIGVVLMPGPVAAILLLSVVLFFLRWVGLFWSVPAILGGREDAGVLGGAMNLAGNVSGFVTPMAVGFIVGATGGYTWALLYFVGAGVIMTVSVLVLDYSTRLAPKLQESTTAMTGATS